MIRPEERAAMRRVLARLADRGAWYTSENPAGRCDVMEDMDAPSARHDREVAADLEPDVAELLIIARRDLPSLLDALDEADAERDDLKLACDRAFAREEGFASDAIRAERERDAMRAEANHVGPSGGNVTETPRETWWTSVYSAAIEERDDARELLDELVAAERLLDADDEPNDVRSAIDAVNAVAEKARALLGALDAAPEAPDLSAFVDADGGPPDVPAGYWKRLERRVAAAPLADSCCADHTKHGARPTGCRCDLWPIYGRHRSGCPGEGGKP